MLERSRTLALHIRLQNEKYFELMGQFKTLVFTSTHENTEQSPKSQDGGGGELSIGLTLEQETKIRSDLANVSTQLSACLKRTLIIASGPDDFDLHELLFAEKIDFTSTGVKVSQTDISLME